MIRRDWTITTSEDITPDKAKIDTSGQLILFIDRQHLLENEISLKVESHTHYVTITETMKRVVISY